MFDPQLSPTQLAGSALNLVRIYARFAAEVFDVFCGSVARRSGSGSDVFNEISEAFQIINEEAERYCVFELGELEHVFGDMYQGSEVHTLTDRWGSRFQELETALAAHDATAVEALLGEMREVNRRLAVAATRRYQLSLEPDHEPSRSVYT